MAARHIFALLGRCGIAYERQQIGLDPGIVKQGIAFCGRTISGYSLASTLLPDEEFEQIILDPIRTCLKTSISVECQQALGTFLFEYARYRIQALTWIVRMAAIHP